MEPLHYITTTDGAKYWYTLKSTIPTLLTLSTRESFRLEKAREGHYLAAGRKRTPP